MKITDLISITELAKLLNKSRPTVYKYIYDYENGNSELLPAPVLKLFTQITSGEIPKRDVYDYCEKWFANGGVEVKKPVQKEQSIGVKEVIRLIKANQDKINFAKLKSVIEEDIAK